MQEGYCNLLFPFFTFTETFYNYMHALSKLKMGFRAFDMQNFILLYNISLVSFWFFWIKRKGRMRWACCESGSVLLFIFLNDSSGSQQSWNLYRTLFNSVNERIFLLFAYLLILLNIFLLGWFCKPFCWRWCHWGRTGTRRNSFFNQPRTDCIEAHHWSLGSQWMSHHHRLVVAVYVSHLVLVFYVEKYISTCLVCLNVVGK